MRTPRRSLAALGCAIALVVAGCGGSDMRKADPGPTPSEPTTPTSTSTPSPPDGDDLAIAASDPHEDSVYPDIGDPSVDALHYDLDLTWDPRTDTLTAQETLILRSTATADEFQLDFGEPLDITELTLDGERADYRRDGKDHLVVAGSVRKDQRYELRIDYSGTPEPVTAPTTRSDFSTTGFTIDPDHETWTMQEPYGAFTWYAVNDQPSDKALYDFELHVPSPWVGIANGEMTSNEDVDGYTTTTYHLAEPAASYLVTLAFGAYDMAADTTPTGTTITYWTPVGQSELLAGLSTAPAALDFLEQYLGPFPFDTAGILVVDSESGMETQTMITLGDTAYSTSPEVVVHEFAHQWYGDRVTPDDWGDVWMSEGMAMYLQLMYQAESENRGIDEVLDDYAPLEAQARAEAGPPGDYDPTMFGSNNIYFGPAFMWNELRKKLGDDMFFSLVRGWPESQDYESSNRKTLEAYWSKESGEDLEPIFDDWLLSPTTPARS